MYACILYVALGATSIVTSPCVVDDNTLIEPSQIVYVDHGMHIDKEIEYYEAPMAYVDYWRLNGVPYKGSWNPDKYIRLSFPGILIVHEPWRTPKVRTHFKHYEKHKEYLTRVAGQSALNRWYISRGQQPAANTQHRKAARHTSQKRKKDTRVRVRRKVRRSTSAKTHHRKNRKHKRRHRGHR